LTRGLDAVKTLEVSKQSLGLGYLVATGVVLAVALLAHAYTALGAGRFELLAVGAGLVPALTLAAAHYWLPRSGLQGEQIWTVAEWGGLGVALLTLFNVAVLTGGLPTASLIPALLASSVAKGGCLGLLAGAMLELQRSMRRLSQSNDVLDRVLRHDVRNNLSVVLNSLSTIERQTSGETAQTAAEARRAVDDLLTTTEKARQIEIALAADRRPQRPVDVVPLVRERATAVRQAYPEATVDVTAPDGALVSADWLLGSALDNVVENAVVHSNGAPALQMSVENRGSEVRVSIADSGPRIPEEEIEVFSAGETQLRHSSGVGLWLVTWIVDSYGGEVSFERTAEGNVVTLTLPGASRLDRLTRTASVSGDI
jgi:signal transduction histidine kinase